MTDRGMPYTICLQTYVIYAINNTMFLTVTPLSRPMWFTSIGAVTSHIVTHVFSSTLTTRGVTIAAIEMW